MKPALYYLTCKDDKEAETIIRLLLKKKLVVCVKRIPVDSSFLWNGSINLSHETMLTMDSYEENFDSIEKVIKRVHSYETFVLVAVSITRTTLGVLDWMKKELGE